MAPTSARYRDALRSRDYRLLITAFLIDHTGSWAYNVVLVVYAFDRTGSATWVSVFLAAGWVPKALLAPYAGLIADRYERTALMRLSAFGSFVVMAILALLMYADMPIPALLAASVLAAVVLSPYNPAAQALLVDSVDEAQLPAANSLFLTIENLVVVVGPALGGLLLLTGEPATVVALNSVSFLVTLALVSRIRTRSRGGAHEESADSVVRKLTAGVRALRGEPLAAVLLLYCLLGTAAAATTQVFYVQLSQRLGTGTEGYGYLLAAFSIGGVLSALITNRLATGRLAPAVLGGMLMLSLPFAAVAWVENPVLGAALQVIAGAGMVIVDVLAITALQRTMPKGVLSRVFALLDSGVYLSALAASIITATLLAATDLTTTLLVLGLGTTALSIACIGPVVRADKRAAATLAEIQPRLALLERLDLFAALPRPALEELARSMEEVAAEADQVLIRQGDPADALWILRTGQVDISTRWEDGFEQQLPSLGPDSYFGEIGLLRDVPRTATVRAAVPATLYRIGAEPFLAAVQGGRVSASLLASADLRLGRRHFRHSSASTPGTSGQSGDSAGVGGPTDQPR